VLGRSSRADCSKRADSAHLEQSARCIASHACVCVQFSRASLEAKSSEQGRCEYVRPFVRPVSSCLPRIIIVLLDLLRRAFERPGLRDVLPVLSCAGASATSARSLQPSPETSSQLVSQRRSELVNPPGCINKVRAMPRESCLLYCCGCMFVCRCVTTKRAGNAKAMADISNRCLSDLPVAQFNHSARNAC
jgi:hypothetical protein